MQPFDPAIFKAYDIRGIYPTQINGDIAYLFGNALAIYLKPRSVAVGQDMRVSSPELYDGLSRGITDAGVDVVDIGLVSTDGLYFAVGKYGYDAGVMITASHNPKQYNGFKVCRNDAIPLSGSEGLNVIRDIIEKQEPKIRPLRGAMARRDISREYTEKCLSFVNKSVIKPFNIVFDAGNGMAGITLPSVLAHLPVVATNLYFELNGNFPNHPASPLEVENLRDLVAAIKEKKADFGVAFDGDADRMFLVDHTGRQVGGDMVTAMVAQELLTKKSGETILYNAICSRAVPELVTSLGGKPVRTPVGHALIKPMMRERGAIFAGEHSGHFYFRDNWYTDSGMIAFLVCLELLSKSQRTLADIVASINPYFRSGEINSSVENQSGKIAEITAAFADGTLDRLDGLTISYPEYWFNVRPSNTEPLLRLNVEANTPIILTQVTDRVLRIIRQ